MLLPEYGRCPVCSNAPKEIVYYDGSAMCTNCKEGLQKLHDEVVQLEKDNSAEGVHMKLRLRIEFTLDFNQLRTFFDKSPTAALTTLRPKVTMEKLTKDYAE